MRLCQLVYVSLANPELRSDELNQIVARSAIKNADRGITGVLISCGRQLMQLIEGDETAIDALFETIRKDPRHGQVELLIRKSVDRRMFSEWGMKLVDIRKGANLDRSRLSQMVDDVRSRYDTARHSVEARLLLNDFRRQLAESN
jgi:hypothetical protein